jgi:hypothetical protein
LVSGLKGAFIFMVKTPNISDIISNALNEERPLEDVAADLGALILNMEHEKKYYGEHTKRMADLEKLAEIQRRVVSRMLDNSIDKSDQPKRPHLVIVK